MTGRAAPTHQAIRKPRQNLQRISKAPAPESAREPAPDRRAKPIPPAERQVRGAAATDVCRAAARCDGDIDIGIRRHRSAARQHRPHADRSASAARSSARAGLRSRPTRHAVGRRTHRGVRSRGRLRQASRDRLSRAPSRISSPRPGARRRPPPRRRPSGKRAARARRSLARNRRNPRACASCIVAGAAVLIAGVFLHVALRMFQDRATPSNSPDTPPATPSKRQHRPRSCRKRIRRRRDRNRDR